MNIVIYNLLKKVNKEKVLEDNYLDDLYKYYTNYIEEKNIYISDNDFKKFFSISYDILSLRTNFEEFDITCKCYLNYIIADSLNNELVDLKWFINNIWYLSISSNNIDTNINDCLLFIQNKLIGEFKIKENIKTRTKRKIRTKALTV